MKRRGKINPASSLHLEHVQNILLQEKVGSVHERPPIVEWQQLSRKGAVLLCLYGACAPMTFWGDDHRCTAASSRSSGYICRSTAILVQQSTHRRRSRDYVNAFSVSRSKMCIFSISNTTSIVWPVRALERGSKRPINSLPLFST